MQARNGNDKESMQYFVFIKPRELAIIDNSDYNGKTYKKNDGSTWFYWKI